MIAFALSTGRESRDTAEAEWQGRVHRATSAHGATMKLARQLVEAGCPDLACSVPGRTRGSSLHRLATLTVEADSLRFRRYRANTHFPPGGATLDGAEGAERLTVGAT
jgi:hypothetical protein